MMKKHNILKINQLEKKPLIINELCIIEKNIWINVWKYQNSFVPSGYISSSVKYFNNKNLSV